MMLERNEKIFFFIISSVIFLVLLIAVAVVSIDSKEMINTIKENERHCLNEYNSTVSYNENLDSYVCSSVINGSIYINEVIKTTEELEDDV